MPLLEHPVIRPLRVHRQPIELPRKPGREVADVDHLLHFALALGHDLAHFERDQPPQLGLVGAQALADLPHHLAAFRRRHRAPPQERLVGARNDAVVLVLRNLPDARDPRPVDRRVNVEHRPRSDPLAAEPARVHVVDAEGR